MATRPLPVQKQYVTWTGKIGHFSLNKPEDVKKLESIKTLALRGLAHITLQKGPEPKMPWVYIEYAIAKEMSPEEVQEARQREVDQLQDELKNGAGYSKQETMRVLNSMNLTADEKELLEELGEEFK